MDEFGQAGVGHAVDDRGAICQRARGHRLRRGVDAADDMEHDATVVAAFVYLVAIRGEKLPRTTMLVQ